MASKKAQVHAAAEAHTVELRRTMDRLLDRGVAPVWREYEGMVKAIQTKLRSQLKGELHQPVSEKGLATASSTIERACVKLAVRIGEEMADAAKLAMREALTTSNLGLFRTMGVAPPTAETGVGRKLIADLLPVVQDARHEVGNVMMNNLTKKLLSDLPYLASKSATTGSFIENISSLFYGEWYRVLRAVRTQTSALFNAVQAEVLRQASEEDKRLRLRWTELVDDITGIPMDDRVAEDSEALHGQLAKPGGLFTIPPQRAARLPDSRLIGKHWAHPPNRPNDRAVLSPWLPGWGIPGWYLSGRRVIEVR